MNVNELIQKTKEKGPGLNQPDYWFGLEKELRSFLNDPKVSKQEKDMLQMKGRLEMVYMMCRGIEST